MGRASAAAAAAARAAWPRWPPPPGRRHSTHLRNEAGGSRPHCAFVFCRTQFAHLTRPFALGRAAPGRGAFWGARGSARLAAAERAPPSPRARAHARTRLAALLIRPLRTAPRAARPASNMQRPCARADAHARDRHHAHTRARALCTPPAARCPAARPTQGLPCQIAAKSRAIWPPPRCRAPIARPFASCMTRGRPRARRRTAPRPAAVRGAPRAAPRVRSSAAPARERAPLPLFFVMNAFPRVTPSHDHSGSERTTAPVVARQPHRQSHQQPRHGVTPGARARACAAWRRQDGRGQAGAARRASERPLTALSASRRRAARTRAHTLKTAPASPPGTATTTPPRARPRAASARACGIWREGGREGRCADQRRGVFTRWWPRRRERAREQRQPGRVEAAFAWVREGWWSSGLGAEALGVRRSWRQLQREAGHGGARGRARRAGGFAPQRHARRGPDRQARSTPQPCDAPIRLHSTHGHAAARRCGTPEGRAAGDRASAIAHDSALTRPRRRRRLWTGAGSYL